MYVLGRPGGGESVNADYQLVQVGNNFAQILHW